MVLGGCGPAASFLSSVGGLATFEVSKARSRGIIIDLFVILLNTPAKSTVWASPVCNVSLPELLRFSIFAGRFTTLVAVGPLELAWVIKKAGSTYVISPSEPNNSCDTSTCRVILISPDGLERGILAKVLDCFLPSTSSLIEAFYCQFNSETVSID